MKTLSFVFVFFLSQFIGCRTIPPSSIELKDTVRTQQCKVEWYGGVYFANYQELYSLVELRAQSSNCIAPNILCIYLIHSNECSQVVIFEKLEDIPRHSLKGKCEEYVISYDQDFDTT